MTARIRCRAAIDPLASTANSTRLPSRPSRTASRRSAGVGLSRPVAPRAAGAGRRGATAWPAEGGGADGGGEVQGEGPACGRRAPTVRPNGPRAAERRPGSALAHARHGQQPGPDGAAGRNRRARRGFCGLLWTAGAGGGVLASGWPPGPLGPPGPSSGPPSGPAVRAAVRAAVWVSGLRGPGGSGPGSGSALAPAGPRRGPARPGRGRRRGRGGGGAAGPAGPRRGRPPRSPRRGRARRPARSRCAR